MQRLLYKIAAKVKAIFMTRHNILQPLIEEGHNADSKSIYYVLLKT